MINEPKQLDMFSITEEGGVLAQLCKEDKDKLDRIEKLLGYIADKLTRG